MAIRQKLLVPTLLFIALSLIGIQALLTGIEANQNVRREQTQLRQLSLAFDSKVNDLRTFAIGLAYQSASNPDIQAAFAAQDRQRLQEITLPTYELLDQEFGIPQYQFHTPPATSFLRLHQLDRFGDDLSSFRQTVIIANAEKRAVGGLEIGRGGLGVRGVVPVTYQGNHVGTVEFGLNVDQNSLQELKEQFDADWQIWLLREPAEIATFVSPDPDAPSPLPELVFQASTQAEPIIASSDSYAQVLTGDTSFSRRVTNDEGQWTVYSVPLRDFSGQIIGVTDIILSRTTFAQLQVNQGLIFLGTTLLALTITSIGLTIIITRTMQPVKTLTQSAEILASGNLNFLVPVTSRDELGTLARSFNSMATQLRELIAGLEERVAQRTRDLEVAAEIGQRMTQIYDLDHLLPQATNLICERFGLYQVQIYLPDEEHRFLVLVASSGAAGQELLKLTHRLPIGPSSLNGQAARLKQPVVSEDTQSDPFYLPHPLLPETRSEMAIPLLAGEHLVGVLDLQSTATGAFTTENRLALETLAGQLAIAIDNASLFATRTQIEADLRRFKLGIERSTSAIFLTDVDGRILYINPAFESLYGYHQEEALGQTPRILKSGVLSVEVYQHFWHELQSGHVVSGEIINKTKDGRLLTISGSNNPIISEDGTLIGFLGLHTDITSRKQTEITLAKRVAELKCLNIISRLADMNLAIPDFLTNVAKYIPPAMQYPEFCRVAITWEGQVYGQPEATTLPCHVVEGLRVGKELTGRIYVAYTETKEFFNEESTLLGGVGYRVSSYIESRQLLTQLQIRATELQTVAEVSTAVARTLNVEALLQQVVDLTKVSFNLYHAHIYLYDASSEHLVLAAGAGEVGRQMVAEGRRISLHQFQSLVARAGRTQQGVLVNDVRQEAGFLPHHLLPHTLSEMATPLIAGGQLLGVLDVQAKQVNRFSAADLNIYMTLAAQTSVALQNAYQYAQTQTTLQEVQGVQQALIRQGWQEYWAMQSRSLHGYTAAKNQVMPLTQIEQATAVTHPLTIRGTTVGGLGVHLPSDQTLTPEATYLLNALSDQVSQALERARLTEQTQAALSEAETLSQLGARLNAAQSITQINQDIANILRTVTHEALTTSLFEIELNEQEEPAWLIMVATTDPSLAATQFQRLPVTVFNEHPAWLARGGTPVLITDTQSDIHLSDIEKMMYRQLGVRSLAVLPLRLGDRWIGLSIIAWQEAVTFAAAETRLLTAMTAQVALAMNSIQLLHLAQKRAQREQMLREIATRVNAAGDANSILQVAAREVGQALELETFVFLTDMAGDRV